MDKKEKVKWSRRLTRNLGLKIVSFLLAVTLWLLVVNIDDPVVRWTYLDVPVTIKNAEVITNQGMIYEVLDDTDIIPRVTIYAPRSVGENISKSDIVATADMNTLNSLNTLQVEFSVPKVGNQIGDIRGSTDSVRVSIEKECAAGAENQCDRECAGGLCSRKCDDGSESCQGIRTGVCCKQGGFGRDQYRYEYIVRIYQRYYDQCTGTPL